MKKTLIVVILFTFVSSITLAHPGKTDAEGCHNDHKTKTRHCHSTN